jgi:hypothetical protein
MKEGPVLDPVWDPSGKAREALRSIVSDFGTRALSSPSILDNVLHDLLPDSPKQVSLILATGGSQVATTLQEHVAQGMDADTAVRLAAAQLAEQTPYDAAGCRWVTAEFARALGYPVSDDPVAQQAPPPPATPTPSAPVMPATPVAPVVPADQAQTVPPPDLATGPGLQAPPAAPKKRRRALLVLLATLVIAGGLVGGAAATSSWPFSSGPVALNKLLPGDVTECSSKVEAFENHIQGLTAKVGCQVTSIGGVMFGYQFDSSADYQSALADFNRVSGFDAAKATGTCPPAAGHQGETKWFTTGTGLYPKAPGQILECYRVRFNSNPSNPLQPIYVWTIPSQNTFLQAIASVTTSAKDLDTWWTHNGGPDS